MERWKEQKKSDHPKFDFKRSVYKFELSKVLKLPADHSFWYCELFLQVFRIFFKQDKLKTFRSACANCP